MKKDWAQFFYPPSGNTTRISIGLLLVRVIAGLAFMFHGWPKIQNPFGWMGEEAPVPGIIQALPAVAEFAGGFCWIIGALMPLACFGLFCTMAVATAFHISRGDPFVASGGGSYELALVFLSISVLLFLTGPGRFAVDALFFRQTKRLK
jgi:putative oxidoreductase